ncbi:LysR family transcriptional regulator [Gluconacetobacter azotocaptans]|uniref:LysR family transcriptional regulator n=1 Tax=Gluconacetobacter azotocaptans TaxID=142834 RepID=UPI00195CEF9E|nr:LysR family transcriptional regulator [Gluconacetobacter azotocaptans]MBM9400685.1 LysR family transcriptional regulator [Gluconacetobacter azotocaptans]
MIAELRTFVLVARLGSFAAAARQIGLTQAAIGAQIRRLEQELGYEVFDRSGWSVTLSGKGGAILPEVEGILSSFNGLRHFSPREPSRRTLRVGAISTTQTSILAPAVAALSAEMPSLMVRLVPGISMVLLDRLDAGDLDAALIVRPPLGPMPHMTWHPLVTQDYVMVLPERMPGDDWQQVLMEQPFIRYDSRSFGGRTLDRFLRAQHLAPRSVIETEEVHTILQMVASNMGCTIIPRVLAIGLLPNIRTLPLGEHRISREVGLMTVGPHQDAAIAALIGHLAAAARKSVSPSPREGGRTL